MWGFERLSKKIYFLSSFPVIWCFRKMCIAMNAKSTTACYYKRVRILGDLFFADVVAVVCLVVGVLFPVDRLKTLLQVNMVASKKDFQISALSGRSDMKRFKETPSLHVWDNCLIILFDVSNLSFRMLLCISSRLSFSRFDQLFAGM